jgi:uncharacterized protein (DUF342 family)
MTLKILDCVVEPMLQMCSISAINLSITDMAVYMINCIYSMHSMLSLYEYTDAKLEKLEAQVNLDAEKVCVELDSICQSI